ERSRDALAAGGVDHVVVVGDVPDGIPGGERRRDSVRAGLDALGGSAEWVLVHDAARPLASADLVGRVIARLVAGDVDGVVPVVAVRDTLKRVDGGRIVETVDRAPLVAAQTPQGFRVRTLLAAHDADRADASDDALLVERAGGTVVTVEGDPVNMKITYAGDLAVAEALLA
ncbi:MAG TPA: 2-C-methyl-D-erythritol 4-phosphate cytidylyltransferase, partial [Acidimicrobiia bacterium]|nr:2-C-methyl-D-erythritol 4-phosphate cytidylyltransferase [Acidimicrobiia bacterium]